MFAERGWKVFLLGVGILGEQNLRVQTHGGLRVLKLPAARPGWRQKRQYAVFSLMAIVWSIWFRPKWIYASDPLACPVARMIQTLTGAGLIYHEHDSPSQNMEVSSFMRLALRYRQKVALSADICILPQYERMVQFVTATRRTGMTYCIWNCPRLREIIPLASSKDADLKIYYHGTITPVRLPAELILAACRFKGRVRITIVGYEPPGNEGYGKGLQALSERSGAPGVIEFIGAVPREHLFQFASGAHLGVSFVPKDSHDVNMQYMVGASNKAFDYMACGLPLLVTDLRDWVNTFVEPGYGRACNPGDVDSIERELSWYLENPAQRKTMARKCQEKIRTDWNYDAMFSDVLAHVEND